MSTGLKKVNIYLKKFLPQQQITDNFLEYLNTIILESFAQTWQTQGIFTPNANVTQILSSDTADTFDVINPLIGTDGPQGHILDLDALYSNNIPFENAIGINYFAGLRFASIPSGTEVNVRTSKIKYTFDEERIGEVSEPNSVVHDGDETLTLIVDSIFEAGVSHAGREVLVYLKNPVSQADTFETAVVIWDGTNNIIETSTSLGQPLGNISTNANDYEVFAPGVTVRRNTDLRLDEDIMFIGIITGGGSGNQPSGFNQDDVSNLSFGLGGIIDLFDNEHYTTDGTHRDINADTITTKPSVEGIQLDTEVNASDEDSPDTPIVHTLFSSGSGSGLQSAKWVMRDSGGNIVAFIDAHGNAYFQNLAAVDSVFQSNLIVEGNTTLGDDINTDTITFNAVQKSLTDLIYIIDSNADGANSYKFYNQSILAANLLMEVLSTGDVEVKRDVIAGAKLRAGDDTLTGSKTAYSKNSDLTEILVDASLNEVFDETLNRKLLKVNPNNPADKQVTVDASFTNLNDGSEYRLSLGTQLTDFDGGFVDFQNGNGSVEVQTFTVFDFTGAADEWFKYSLNLLANGEIKVNLAETTGLTKDAAAEPELESGAIGFAVVAVQNDSATSTTAIRNIDETNITRIPVAGGSGAGEADIQKEFAIQDAQTTKQDLTGLIFDSAETKSIRILVDIFRRTDGVVKNEVAHLILSFDNETGLWLQPRILNSGFDDAGVTFFQDASTGQVQYKSTDLSGAGYVGEMRIRDITEIPQVSVDDKVIANNQTTKQDLPDLIFDSTTDSSVRILYDIFRRTDSAVKNEVGELALSLNKETGLWLQPRILNSGFDDAGVTFFQDASTGQVQYKSTDLSGLSYSGTLRTTDIVIIKK